MFHSIIEQTPAKPEIRGLEPVEDDDRRIDSFARDPTEQALVRLPAETAIRCRRRFCCHRLLAAEAPSRL